MSLCLLDSARVAYAGVGIVTSCILAIAMDSWRSCTPLAAAMHTCKHLQSARAAWHIPQSWVHGHLICGLTPEHHGLAHRRVRGQCLERAGLYHPHVQQLLACAAPLAESLSLGGAPSAFSGCVACYQTCFLVSVRFSSVLAGDRGQHLSGPKRRYVLALSPDPYIVCARLRAWQPRVQRGVRGQAVGCDATWVARADHGKQQQAYAERGRARVPAMARECCLQIQFTAVPRASS